MATQPKTAQLQIRVSPAQKADLVRRARAAGVDLSAFVLSRVLPDTAVRFVELVRSLSAEPRDPFVLAELGNLLTSIRGGAAFRETVSYLPSATLDRVSSNLLAAMVETRGAALGIRPPDWVVEILPLEAPWFATALLSVRLHLLCNAPPAFRRRNLFVDSTLEDRV
jgi:hypothetical protein